MSSRQLCDYVFSLCGSGARGGRAVVVSKDTCLLYDISQWTDGMTRCVKNRYPSVDVTVSHSCNSLTGFQIVFVLAPIDCNYVSSFATFAFVVLTSIPLLYTLFTWVSMTVVHNP
jgi:hypothetical protein